MKTNKCGIYEIKCRFSGKSYVGSSKRIYARWSEHRQLLRRGTHPSPRLQQAWNKHGEDDFTFSVLEECNEDQLLTREQYYLDLIKRDYNSMPRVKIITREMRTKMRLRWRALADLITHCPKGHPYNESNTYVSKQNQRVCRVCNAERVAKIIAAETPEQREARREKVKSYNDKTRDERVAHQKIYTAEHKQEKSLYDKTHRAHQNELRRLRILNESPEQHQRRLDQKRESRRRLALNGY